MRLEPSLFFSVILYETSKPITLISRANGNPFVGLQLVHARSEVVRPRLRVIIVHGGAGDGKKTSWFLLSRKWTRKLGLASGSSRTETLL